MLVIAAGAKNKVRTYLVEPIAFMLLMFVLCHPHSTSTNGTCCCSIAPVVMGCVLMLVVMLRFLGLMGLVPV